MAGSQEPHLCATLSEQPEGRKRNRLTAALNTLHAKQMQRRILMTIDTMPLAPPTIAEALALGTATLHEAGGQIGALPSSIRGVSDRLPVAGRVFPIALPPGDNLWLHHAIYAAEPGDVLVATAGGGLEHGYFGEVLARAAQHRGIAGLVIEGGVRDARQLDEIGFPVFASRRCIRGTTKNPRLNGALGSSISIGGVLIEQGDLVVGDADGVIVIPRDRADEVVAQGRQREEDERRYFDRLSRGETTIDIYSLPAVPQRT